MVRTEEGVVAIVEDDPHILHALSMWVKLHGYLVSCHMSAESINKLICLKDGRLALFDAIDYTHATHLAGAILDLNLPGITGIDLAREWRKMDAFVPLTIITALRDEERARFGELPSNVQCLRKPFEMEALDAAFFPLQH